MKIPWPFTKAGVRHEPDITIDGLFDGAPVMTVTLDCTCGARILTREYDMTIAGAGKQADIDALVDYRKFQEHERGSGK